MDRYSNDLNVQADISAAGAQRNEETPERFFHHVDNILGHVLNAYDLPLFVLGTDKTVQHFKKITRHNDRIINYVHGNYGDIPQTEMKKAIAPYVSDWKKVKERDLLLQLNAAREFKKLATGIQEVWKEVTRKKGRLLIVERTYMYSGQQDYPKDITHQKSGIPGTAFFIKDAVDDVIEKVLQNGGDVEFVDEGVLKDYRHIALIQHYYHT